ncbi:hypothetical protein RAS1_01390 [Phycisphaerae bacterium RAS1]|nr:hypothetical protein RAS1_01390 [Phycisphaerae bacterium RAS1]
MSCFDGAALSDILSAAESWDKKHSPSANRYECGKLAIHRPVHAGPHVTASDVRDL